MSINEPSFTIGIEEEYLLVDPETRDLANNPPDELLGECEERLGDLIKPEFLKSQIEVATGVCKNIAEGREDLIRLRGTVAEIARKHGLSLIAASTHPFSKWQAQQHTDKERYHILAKDMQTVARRLLICGMHVHVGLDDDELRIDLMNQVSYFLPHILALSTSSPFWQGENTGLKSYRLSVFDELPRTGLPERFDSYAEYRRHIEVLISAGTIKDSSMMWWDIRPSNLFPTLEMRIADVCTYLEDALSVAALFVCIMRMLYRLRRDNQRWRIYANMLINENRWRAQRYGLDEGFMDYGKGVMVPCGDLLDELIDLVGEDAEALNCTGEISHLRDIFEHGTSAHRQLAVYKQSIDEGKTEQQALNDVVDMLIEGTLRGI